jgi:hypothetical protein
MDKLILKKIKEKREFSQLPDKDIEIAFSKFSRRQVSEDEKIILTKEFLRKTFTAFISKKLLSLKDKEPEWILRKHISTRERLPYYEEIYERIFEDYKSASVIDLGAGINGFSYPFFSEIKIDYIAVESLGQLNDLTNFYFKNNKLNGKAVHMSLFELENVKKIITKTKKPRIVFMFKVIDALESFQRDYSKELLLKIISSVDKIVLSFATKSLGKRTKFRAKRNWIINFVNENFNLLDDFELGGERYIIFSK